MQTDGTFQQLFGMRWHGLAHLLNIMVSSAFSIVGNELQTTQRKSNIPTSLMLRIQVFWIVTQSTNSQLWGQGELAGPYLGPGVSRGDTAGLSQALRHSSGVIDANKHNISPPKTVCAW